jgi:hypothetical protein
VPQNTETGIILALDVAKTSASPSCAAPSILQLPNTGHSRSRDKVWVKAYFTSGPGVTLWRLQEGISITSVGHRNTSAVSSCRIVDHLSSIILGSHCCYIPPSMILICSDYFANRRQIDPFSAFLLSRVSRLMFLNLNIAVTHIYTTSY